MDSVQKTCRICKVEKLIDEFAWRDGRHKYRETICRECDNATRRKREFPNQRGPLAGLTEKRCTGCGLVKPIDEYYFENRGIGQRWAKCKTCCNAMAKARYVKKPKVVKPEVFFSEKKCSKCGIIKSIDRFGIKLGRRRDGSVGKDNICNDCKNSYQKEYEIKHGPSFIENRKKKWSLWRDRLRNEILEAYGGKCTCCGEDHKDFLAVDHKNNDGNKHRRELRRTGSDFYSWIKKNNFPPILQLLCHNCNMAKAFYGRCIHEVERERERDRKPEPL